jgi:hypothetical protein
LGADQVSATGMSPSRGLALAAPSVIPLRMDVQWPPLFEPRVLACKHGAHSAIVLSRHGRGTIVSPSPIVVASKSVSARAVSFALESATSAGPLLAASWDDAGLLLVTAIGEVLDCPGSEPINSRWRCKIVDGARLPLGVRKDAFAGAIAIARHATLPSTFRAAISFPGEDNVVFFNRPMNRMGAPWLPAGEIRAPTSARITAASFGADDTLLLTARDGALTKLRLSNGRMQAMTLEADHDQEWHGSCNLPSGDVASLSVRAGTVNELRSAMQEPTLHLIGANTIV